LPSPDKAYLPSEEKATVFILCECPNCTKISGPCLLPAGASFSEAKAEAELMDNMATIPNQTDRKRNKLLNLSMFYLLLFKEEPLFTESIIPPAPLIKIKGTVLFIIPIFLFVEFSI